MVYVDSEIKKLHKVIIHHPDSGIGRISPKRAEQLLFDDIVYLPKMKEEHLIFSAVLDAFVGKENVIDTETLIAEALDHNDELRQELIALTIAFEELPKKHIQTLSALDSQSLTQTLITGYLEAESIILFDPIPNFIFTRDIAVVVREHVVITKAAKSARYRENLLTRFIFAAHPDFENLKDEGKVINLNDIEAFPPSHRGEQVSIEGGDVMMIGEKYLLIGCSERTTNHAFHALKEVLFEKNAVEFMVQIDIPDDRSCMHIDTLFTRIDEDVLACYKPVVYDGLGSSVKVFDKSGLKRQYHSVKEFFVEEINKDMKFVFSGNGKSPFQEREQWTDACNLVVVRPGIGLTYDRNEKTADSFKEHGYTILKAEDFLKSYKEDPAFAERIKKTIITLPSSELSRGRGGTHCMTCPISRS